MARSIRFLTLAVMTAAAAVSSVAAAATPTVFSRFVPCQYEKYDTVLVATDCGSRCNINQQFVVHRRLMMWKPDVNKRTTKPYISFTMDFICTPPKMLADRGESVKKGLKLTCFEVFSTDMAQLCNHLPTMPVCAWNTKAAMTLKLAKALKVAAAVDPKLVRRC